jgi:L-ascorbate metabolism protein UlaG (beta-lactamase superfamily)
MNIQYYGHSCFKITTKPSGRATDDVVVFTDPFDRSIGLRPPQGQADVVFVSHEHSDHNNAEVLKGDPVILNNPGEYYAKGITAVGMDSFHDTKGGVEKGHNTIFLFESEEVRLCHLGDLGTELTPDQLEEIEGVDILFVPVGGDSTLNGAKAAEMVRKIEPKIVIPMHYKLSGTEMDIEDEKKFCKEIGKCPTEKTKKLTFKKKDLEGKSMEVVIMDID